MSNVTKITYIGHFKLKKTLNLLHSLHLLNQRDLFQVFYFEENYTYVVQYIQ